MRMQYVVGHFAHKAWKYLIWFLVNASIVNAFIIYQKVSTRTTKKRYAHIHFRQEVACQLIAGFSGQKRKSEAPMYMGPVAPQNEAIHESVHMGTKARRCKWHSQQKIGRKETVFGCKQCGVHLCKEGCHYAYHHQN